MQRTQHNTQHNSVPIFVIVDSKKAIIKNYGSIIYNTYISY